MAKKVRKPIIHSQEVTFGVYGSSDRLKAPHIQATLRVLRGLRRLTVLELEDTPTPWPHIDCLLVIYSPGLPLDRAKALEGVCLVNDVTTIEKLQSRSFICQKLEQHGIVAPPYWVLRPDQDVQEFDDHLVIDEVTLAKPFIEKPLPKSNHRLAIYYTSETGRGCTVLDKHALTRSAEYFQRENRRRKDQDYIYQPFLQTDGLNIRIHVVGTDYFHAVAHKSPVLNHKKTQGRDKKYPVILTAEEKDLAMKVTKAFGQSVITFDVIRSEGKSYVIDVKPSNLVNASDPVISECARSLCGLVLRLTKRTEPALSHYSTREEIRTLTYRQERLCALVAIFRHGDRTPKQKIKLKTSHEAFLRLLPKPKEVKLKRQEDLRQLLDIAREVMVDCDAEAKPALEMIVDVMAQSLNADYTPKVQIKPLQVDSGVVTRALVILKWGGTLTHAGVTQCERLGKHFRTVYYRDDTETFHRLHSAYQHDIKCYSSSEGRCQKSAGALLRGLLDLDSDINAVATSMVRNDAPVVQMLDESPPAAEEMASPLTRLLNSESSMIEELSQFSEDLPTALLATAERIGSPRQHLMELRSMMEALLKRLEVELKHVDGNTICGGESSRMIYQRWLKMYSSFFNSSRNEFEIGRIPELNDCIRYDILHNQELVGEEGRSILDKTRFLSKLVSNLEYGFSREDKRQYCSGVIRKLMRKIWSDLKYWMSVEMPNSEEMLEDQNDTWFQPLPRHIRTRLYFTSLSHLNSFLALISQTAKNWPTKSHLDSVMSLEYLGHFVLKLYEDEMRGPFDPKRFRAELWMSPGVNLSNLESIEQHTAPIAPGVLLHSKLRFPDLHQLFGCAQSNS